jgi:hypothetical protein
VERSRLEGLDLGVDERHGFFLCGVGPIECLVIKAMVSMPTPVIY